MLNPGVIGVPLGGCPVGPSLVGAQELARPVAHVERGIGQDEVGFQVGVQVAKERISGLVTKVGLDAPERQVHMGEPPSRRVRLLAEDGNVRPTPAVSLDEPLGLDEHPARPATRVVNAAVVGLQHLDQQADHAGRGEEFAPELPLGLRELAEEVFVDPAEGVAGLGAVPFEPDARDEVDQAPHPLGRDAATGVVAGEFPLEGRIVALDGQDGIVDHGGDVRLLGLIAEVRPSRLGRGPEDVLRHVFVAIFEEALLLRPGDAVLVQFELERVAPGLERVGDVFEEEQAEDDVLVFGGIDRAAQLVGGLPEHVGEFERRSRIQGQSLLGHALDSPGRGSGTMGSSAFSADGLAGSRVGRNHPSRQGALVLS